LLLRRYEAESQDRGDREAVRWLFLTTDSRRSINDIGSLTKLVPLRMAAPSLAAAILVPTAGKLGARIFADGSPCQAPRLSATEIDEVAVFLGTLTDGYDATTDSADPARSVTRTPTD
jgi:hypothetical protein